MLSDADLTSKSADALGVPAASLTLLDRRADGVNTYADFRATNGAQYHCLINGGNLLSMGMTNDMALAIAEGSTIVRVGTAIFGPRAFI